MILSTALGSPAKFSNWKSLLDSYIQSIYESMDHCHCSLYFIFLILFLFPSSPFLFFLLGSNWDPSLREVLQILKSTKSLQTKQYTPLVNSYQQKIEFLLSPSPSTLQKVVDSVVKGKKEGEEEGKVVGEMHELWKRKRSR